MREQVTGFLVLGLLSALAAGCASEGGEVLIIRQNQVPEEGCVIPGDVGSTFIGAGTIDVNATELARPAGYLFTPVVENIATTPMNASDSLRLVTIEGAEIQLDGFEFSSAPQEFTQRSSGTVEPDGGTIGLAFEVLGTDHLAELAGAVEPGATEQVIAKVVVFGELADGGVESAPFEYPINVCDGCLLVDRGACSDLPADFQAELTGGACNPLQDASAECCTDADGTLICPAISTAAPM